MIKAIRNKASGQHNLAKWVEKEVRVLFITGLSGSGKTTAAKDLATMAGAKLVSLDQYLRKLIRDKLKENSPDYEKAYHEHAIRLLLEDNPEGQLVIEGAHVAKFNQEELKQHAVVVMGTSLLVSTWRACRRDFTKEHWQRWKAIRPDIHIKYNLKNYAQLKGFATSFFA